MSMFSQLADPFGVMGGGKLNMSEWNKPPKEQTGTPQGQFNQQQPQPSVAPLAASGSTLGGAAGMPQLPAGLGWTNAGAAMPTGTQGMTGLEDPNKPKPGGMSVGI